MGSHHSRRQYLKYSAVGISSIAVGGCLGTNGQGDYPSQGIDLIIPYSQGGGTDSYGRIIANTLPDQLGESITVENNPGAGSLLGVGQVVRSNPDGYTLGSMNLPGTPVAYLRDSQPWELSNVEMISTIGGWQFVLLANPDENVEGIDDLIQRYDSGEFSSIGGVSTGNSLHILALYLQNNGIIPWSEYIPYDSGGQAIQNVVSGEVPIAIAGDVPSLSTVEEGSADIIATMTIDGSPVYPDTPSIIDEGGVENKEIVDLLGQISTAWFAPPETPSNIVNTIADGISDTAESDSVAEWEEETGFTVEPEGPEATTTLLEDSLEQIPNAINLDNL